MQIPNKIPTIVGIFLVFGIVASVIFFTERALRAPSQASESLKPVNVRVTNVSDTTFTVSWTTQTPATGALQVITAKKSNAVYYDERDRTGKLGKYLSHSITVRDAVSDTDYFFKPASNSKSYMENGKPYILHTPGALPVNDAGMEPAYGIIKTSTDLAADDAIVYLTVTGGQDLSTLTKPSGSWLIPLNQTRTADLTTYLPTIERMDESITARTGDEISTATTDTLNDSPVPDMNLGKEYDFRRQQAKTAGNSNLALRPVTKSNPLLSTATPALSVGGAVLGTNTAQTYSVSITSPKNGAAIATTLPLFQGTGVPGKFIGLSIGFVNAIHASVKVATNGIWSYTPGRQLNIGKQSITITSVDSKGKSVAVTHDFSILKSGTQVLGDATPSATLTPQLTLTTTPVISTETATPTETPVEESTLSATPPPVTGSELPTILLILIGIGLVAGGTLAFAW